MTAPSTGDAMGEERVKITAKMFKKATGCKPQDDDLERCNCDKAGTLLHQYCGWDDETNRPKFWPKMPRTMRGE